LGGNAKLLYNGQIIQEYNRYKNLGEYIISCTFSPLSNFFVLNSALENNQFCRNSYIRLYEIGRIQPIMEEPTIIRQNCEFQWKNVYTFNNDETMFAYVNFTSNLIKIYNLQNYNFSYIKTNVNMITTMIFSNDNQYLIWKEGKHGNITMFKLSTNSIYKQFSTDDDSSDVNFYNNPSMIINDDNTYLIDCSSNTESVYIINILTGNYDRLNFPWMGYKLSFYKDSILYISFASANTLAKYNITLKKSNPLAFGSYFKVLDEKIIVLYKNMISYCDIDNFNNCSYGEWNNNLLQISNNNNSYHTIDNKNNLVKWINK
jgi:hypothetical protein